MTGRLNSVHIQGFKALEDCRFEPHPQLTVIIGANGTGKTSVLDAIQLLADLARPHPDPLGGDARGSLGVAAIPLLDLATAWIEPRRVQIEITFEVGSRRFAYHVRLVPLGARFRVESEALTEAGTVGEDVLLLERDAGGARIRRGKGAGAQLVPVGASPEQAVLSFAKDDISYPEVAPAWRFVAGISILRLTPVLMRWPNPPTHQLALPDRYGRDLRARLHALQTSSPRAVPSWIGWMKSFVGWAEVRTPVVYGQVEPAFLEDGGQHPIQLVSASDGSTLHAYLATLAVDPPADVSVYLVDELGVPYFPESTSQMGELLLAMSGTRQIIVVSHSEAVVEAIGNLDRIWTLDRAPSGPAQLRRLRGSDDALAEDVAIRGVGKAAFATPRPMPESTE